MGSLFLLIEDEQGVSSLKPLLEQNQHQIEVVHSLLAASDRLQVLWPDAIIFHQVNCFGVQNMAFDPVQLNQASKVPQMEIPQLIFGHHLKEVDQAHIASPEELLVQIEKILEECRFVRAGPFTLDRQTRQLLRQDGVYRLTPKLVELLTLLMLNENKIISRKTLMQEIWQTDYMGDTRTLDVHIRWVREKLEIDPSYPVYLQTVRREGYIFSSTGNEAGYERGS